MSVNQSDVQASIRAATGTALPFEGDWHALFDQASIATGPFDGRLLAWINAQLVASYTSLPTAQQALAASRGFANWSSMTSVI